MLWERGIGVRIASEIAWRVVIASGFEDRTGFVRRVKVGWDGGAAA